MTKIPNPKQLSASNLGFNKYMLLLKVLDTINRYSMLKYGDKVLVGVSAGPDSVCLLYVLKELREEYNLSLHIAHLHHGFRGSEADEDVRFVKAIGDSLGIPLHIEYVDIPSYIKRARLSKQAGAREVRYKFFYRVAEEIGADKIALGHTADDQIETFLMRVIKGSGPHGLAGIPPVRDKVIRPVIEIYREEIKEYLSERDIRYRIDSSNLSPVYLRNKIRLELIPYLSKEYNPNIIDTLMRNLKILRDEDIFLDEYVEKKYPDLLISESKGHVRFDMEKLASIARPIRRRVLRRAVESIIGEGVVVLSFKHVEDSLSLLDNERGGEIHLPCGIIVRKDRKTFGVYLKSEVTPIPSYAYNIAVPGDTLIPEAGVTIRTAILTSPDKGVKGEKDGNKYKTCFDMGKFSLPLIVRNRRSGDLFCPQGMGGKKKKIKEYFIDQKIPREERERIPILTSPEGILWIIGYRADERFMVTAATEKILEVRAIKNAA